MSGPEDPASGEFADIARLLRPLTRGAPEAFGLLDDAAAIPSRPGYDLVVTKDAVVEGVHVPHGEAPDLIARKLLRANLSDLAAKGAEPYGYFLATAWPAAWDAAAKAAFAAGLDADGREFGLTLLGGDTVSTPGPMTASATLLGWVPAGGMIRRAGAKPGDLVLVSGTIGDGYLGLKAALGDLDDPDGFLAGRYRLPSPRLGLRQALRAYAHAAADVSDGLIADAGHVATASDVGVLLDLDRLPLSQAALAWLEAQPDEAAARLRLATGGDDYELVCTAAPDAAAALGLTVIGEVFEGAGVQVLIGGALVEPGVAGWTHS